MSFLSKWKVLSNDYKYFIFIDNLKLHFIFWKSSFRNHHSIFRLTHHSSRFVSSSGTFVNSSFVSLRIFLQRFTFSNQWDYATWGTSHFLYPIPPLFLNFLKVENSKNNPNDITSWHWRPSFSVFGTPAFIMIFSAIIAFFLHFCIKLLFHTSSLSLFIFFLIVLNFSHHFLSFLLLKTHFSLSLIS